MPEYRDIKALNWSSLKLMHDSPRMYKWRQDHPRADTGAMSLGRIIHMAILEPDRFELDCVRRPDEWDSWRTKAAREWRTKQQTRGREVLTDEDADLVEIIRERLEGHVDATMLLDGTDREIPLTWEVNGVSCKGRLDALARDRIVDLKTTRDLGLFMRRDAAQMLYHGQLAWYLDGAIAAGRCDDDADAYIVAVETSEPYDIAALRLSTVTLDAGRWLWKSLLDQWVTCKETGLWPGKYPSLEDLDLPSWAAGMWPDETEEI